jgi:hypothetical protein
MGKVTYTIQDQIDGSVQFCSVEQLAIHHYRTEEDYTFGNDFLGFLGFDWKVEYFRYSF